MPTVKERKISKAAELRARADRLDEEIARRTGSDDTFRCGPGGARSAAQRRGQARADRRADASDQRTWALMRERDRLRTEADALDRAARSQVFADDVDGLRYVVEREQELVRWCEAALAGGTPEAERAAARGMDTAFLKESRRIHRAQLKAAQNRLDRAVA